MYQAHIANLELFQGLLRQLFHLIDGHRLIGFVMEVEGTAAARVVANDTLEDDGCSVLRRFQAVSDLRCCDSFLNNGAVRRLQFRLRFALSLSTPAYGRQQAHFITIFQQRRNSRIFLVQSTGNGTGEWLKLSKAVAVISHHIGEAGSGREVQCLLRLSDNVLKLPKEQHANTHESSGYRIPQFVR